MARGAAVIDDGHGQDLLLGRESLFSKLYHILAGENRGMKKFVSFAEDGEKMNRKFFKFPLANLEKRWYDTKK